MRRLLLRLLPLAVLARALTCEQDNDGKVVCTFSIDSFDQTFETDDFLVSVQRKQSSKGTTNVRPKDTGATAYNSNDIQQLYDKPYSQYGDRVKQLLLDSTRPDVVFDLVSAHCDELPSSKLHFDTAVKVLEYAESQNNDDNNDIVDLAMINFYYGELYTLATRFGYIKTGTRKKLQSTTNAVEYYIKAEDLFTKVLDDGDDDNNNSFSRQELLLNQALCAERIGFYHLNQQASTDDIVSKMDALVEQAMNENNDVSIEQNLYAVQEELTARVEENNQQIELAKIKLLQANKIFVQFSKQNVSIAGWKRHWALTLYSLQQAETLSSHYDQAIVYGEHALQLFQDELQSTSSDSNDSVYAETLQSTADSLYSLADLMVRVNKYKEAVDYYTRCMDFYKNHNDIAIPEEEQPDIAETKTAIQTYEQLLIEYNSLSINDNDDEFSGEKYVYERNEASEADIHTTLGSLYQSLDDTLTATSHFEQALRLYKKVDNDDESSLYAASVYFSMALMNFKQGQFADSIAAYQSGVDLYEKAAKKGIYPPSDGDLESLQAELKEIKAEYSSNGEDDDTPIINAAQYIDAASNNKTKTADNDKNDKDEL